MQNFITAFIVAVSATLGAFGAAFICGILFGQDTKNKRFLILMTGLLYWFVSFMSLIWFGYHGFVVQ